MERSVWITNDAVVMGLLAVLLGLVFHTAHSDRPLWRGLYKYVPALFLCYFLPSLLNSLGVVDGERSSLYPVAKNYLLPCSLVLLTMSVDLRRILALGPKALIMFLTGTVGVILGGPIALLAFGLISPDSVVSDGPNALWRGMSTVAGSWIGGAANQAAMRETYEVPGDLFSVMVTVDIVVANVWMAVLLYFSGNVERMDRWLRADTRAIDELRHTVESFQKEHKRDMTLTDMMVMFACAMGITGASHWLGKGIATWFGTNMPALKSWSLDSSFFWLVVLATTGGLILSFTRARNLEGAGASKLGSAFLYILVATVGMQMDITAVFRHYQLFLLGGIWMLVHGLLMIVVAKLVRAPTFFLAVGSQANIGGAASAPVVAAAFHASLAPVGVLLAVLGYVLGTYGAYLSAEMMRLVSGG